LVYYDLIKIELKNVENLGQNLFDSFQIGFGVKFFILVESFTLKYLLFQRVLRNSEITELLGYEEPIIK
jgi:hypothetical protein